MGTVFSFDVRSPGVEIGALDDAEQWLHWVDATFSTYRTDSAVCRLQRGEVSRAGCPREVGEILDAGTWLASATGGYFSSYPGGTLDPSGLVKGWAIERASDLLVAAGSVNHCINGGGDVQCVGDAAPGQPWRIGIADPLAFGALSSGGLAAIAVGTDLAIATSGTAERGTHVVDPHRGVPATYFASISLVGHQLSWTDAYATAAFAMGAQARDWVESLAGYEAFAVLPDGTTWHTSGWVADPA